MGRGGRRAGAGRKPKDRGIVLGMDGTRRIHGPELPPAVTPQERANLLEAPSDLHEIEQGCWRVWAPRALEERTLTPSTEAGFRVLCNRMAWVQTLEAKAQLLNTAGSSDLLGTLKELSKWTSLLATSLKDYKLSAFGKPATSEKPKPAANPWASVAK